MGLPAILGLTAGISVIVVVMIVRERRRARTGTLLWLLAIAARHNRPLNSEVELLVETTSGRLRQDLQNLAAMLQVGDPLPVALERAGGWIPQSAIVAAEVGVQTGTLAQSLGDAARAHTTRRIGSARSTLDVGGLVLYVWIVVLLIFSGAAYLLYSPTLAIVPRTRMIFEDFGVRLPGSTQLLFSSADRMRPFAFLFMPILLIPAGLIIAAAIAVWKGRDPFDFGWIGRWLVRWETPTVLRGLSHAVAANAPLAEGLAAVQRMHSRDKVRRRVGEALQAFEAGEDCWLALQRQGILRKPEMRLLQAAERTGDLSWALRELAASLENRWRYRGLMLLEFVHPAMIVLIGAGMLFLCVALFLPLVELIQILG